MAARKRRDKYRVIAVDKPGYMGEMRSFPTKDEAMSYAESFMRTRKPTFAPAWVAGSDVSAYVLVEEIERGGYHYKVAGWRGVRGQWEPQK